MMKSKLITITYQILYDLATSDSAFLSWNSTIQPLHFFKHAKYYTYMSLLIIFVYTRVHLLSLSYCYLSFKAHLRCHLLQETTSNYPWPPGRVRYVSYISTSKMSVEINWTNSTPPKTNVKDIMLFIKIEFHLYINLHMFINFKV